MKVITVSNDTLEGLAPLRYLPKPYTLPKEPLTSSASAPGENEQKPNEPQQTGAISA